MREETREHHLDQTFAFPSRLRLRGNSGDEGDRFKPSWSLPSVQVQSLRETRKKNRRFRFAKPLACILLLVIVVVALQNSLWKFDEDEEDKVPSMIQRDYSSMSVQDVQLDSSIPKCFHKRPTCACDDTRIPTHRLVEKPWSRAHHLNTEMAQNADIDVLFLGDSIVESWLGTSIGRKTARATAIPPVFQKHFSTTGGGQYEGLALGISGDTSSNLLWRIQNGELPDTLHPPVIWLLIGTNDFGKTWCSAERVLIGVLSVVQYLEKTRPGSFVVVQGLLPRTFHRQGLVSKGRSRKWFSSKAKMPSLWDDIEAVNDELKRYATTHDKVEYFDTNAFFVDPNVTEEELQINSKLMPDYLHPSAEGSDLWFQEIVHKLDKLIPKR